MANPSTWLRNSKFTTMEEYWGRISPQIGTLFKCPYDTKTFSTNVYWNTHHSSQKCLSYRVTTIRWLDIKLVEYHSKIRQRTGRAKAQLVITRYPRGIIWTTTIATTTITTFYILAIPASSAPSERFFRFFWLGDWDLLLCLGIRNINTSRYLPS